MRPLAKLLVVLGLTFYLAASSEGAMVSGTGNGRGAPVEGAYIQGQNTKTKISIFVLLAPQKTAAIIRLAFADRGRSGIRARIGCT